MEILPSFTGVTSRKNIKVTTPISTLKFVTEVALTTEMLYIRIASNGGGVQREIVPTLEFKAIAPFAGLEGHGNLKTGASRFVYMVHLADGNIHLKNNEELLIDMLELDSTKDYEVHGLSAPNRANMVFHYQSGKVDEDQTSLPVSVVDAIYMAIENSYTDINMTSVNGEVQEFTVTDREDLDTFNQNIGVLELGADGLYAYKKDTYHLLNIAQQKLVTIKSTGAAVIKFVTFTKKPY